MPRKKVLTLAESRKRRKLANARQLENEERRKRLEEAAPKRNRNNPKRDEPCICREQVDSLESRICHVEQLVERVLGQLEAEALCPALQSGTVVMGQPGMAPPVPLHVAAESGDTVALVRALVRGTDTNALDLSGDTALHCAARSGEVLSVELVLASGASLDSLDARGATPLAVAVCRGYLSIVEVLLEKGAQVDQPDKEGHTPLMHAVDLRNTQMVSLLVKHGASVTVVDRNGDSPLVTAARDCLMDILALLVCSSSACMTQIVRAVNVAGSSAAFMVLVQAVPISATCSVQSNPLARVAEEGWLRPVKAILSNCVEHQCQRKLHKRNIQHAIMVAKTEDILLMLWQSARSSMRGPAMMRSAAMGWDYALAPIMSHWKKTKISPKHISEINDALRIVATGETAWQLAEAHPRIARTRVGRDAVWRAAERGWYGILKILISNGAPVDAKRDGSTLLHCAASRGHTGCVQLLVWRGASLCERDEDGWTPLHCAAEAGHQSVVETLLKKGADPNAKDPFGLSPLDVATSGHVISLLRGVKK